MAHKNFGAAFKERIVVNRWHLKLVLTYVSLILKR